MKIIDSRNINDYNKNSVSYFTCNSINDDIKTNVSADIIGVFSCQGEKLASPFMYYLFLLASSIGL